MGTELRRFNLSIVTDDIRFNHRFIVFTMFLDGRAVIHIVEEGTNALSEAFLKKKMTTEIWKSITRLWIQNYMGRPEFLVVDQGFNYVSKKLEETSEAAQIDFYEAPIETPRSIKTLERY